MYDAAKEASSLYDDVNRYAAALGCHFCAVKDLCGGIHCRASLMDCYDHCCGGKSDCTIVCKFNHNFPIQHSEIAGFNLDNVPLTPCPPTEPMRSIATLIYHGSKRRLPVAESTVAFRLADLINFKEGTCRFKTRQCLNEHFGIDNSCKIIVTGVDHDERIEPIWKMEELRIGAFLAIAGLEIASISPPNFSTVLNVPRTDNMHSMKRIAIVHEEMCRAGLPAALHVNGRTETDFLRWAKYIKERAFIDTLSYEFITGSGLGERLKQHCDWLIMIRDMVGRDLNIVARGNPMCIDYLSQNYNVTYIETTSFMKAMKRQKPILRGNYGLRWMGESSGVSDCLSTYLQVNMNAIQIALRTRYTGLSL